MAMLEKIEKSGEHCMVHCMVQNFEYNILNNEFQAGINPKLLASANFAHTYEQQSRTCSFS